MASFQGAVNAGLISAGIAAMQVRSSKLLTSMRPVNGSKSETAKQAQDLAVKRITMKQNMKFAQNEDGSYNIHPSNPNANITLKDVEGNPEAQAALKRGMAGLALPTDVRTLNKLLMQRRAAEPAEASAEAPEAAPAAEAEPIDQASLFKPKAPSETAKTIHNGIAEKAAQKTELADRIAQFGEDSAVDPDPQEAEELAKKELARQKRNEYSRNYKKAQRDALMEANLVISNKNVSRTEKKGEIDFAVKELRDAGVSELDALKAAKEWYNGAESPNGDSGPRRDEDIASWFFSVGAYEMGLGKYVERYNKELEEEHAAYQKELYESMDDNPPTESVDG